MISFSSAFYAGLKAGLAAPITLFSAPPAYVVNMTSFSPANAFATVGAQLSDSMKAFEHRGQRARR